MANPTALTATTITNEAFYKCGIANPSTAQKTRATTYFLEEVKDDIWTRQYPDGSAVRYAVLENISVDITTVGINRIATPTDLDELISVSFLNGTHTGTAQAGAASTITLEDGEDAGETEVVGNYILVTGGTGENGLRQVSAYDTDTYVATVSPNWATNPSSDSTYRIITSVNELSRESFLEMGPLGNSFATSDPSAFSLIREGVNSYILLDRPPDASTYGILFKYYSNIHLIDTSEGSTIMTELYVRWMNALVYGCAWKIAEDEDDSKYKTFRSEYERRVQGLIAKELPYSNQFEGFTL